MAARSTAQAATASLEAVEVVYAIDPAEVDLGRRLRPIDGEWAAALAQIMARDGQLTPIEVVHNPALGGLPYLLVAGAHRRAAAAIAGLKVNARIVNADKAERRLREVAENLWRKGLDPIDRASFVAEMHDLLRARAGIAADTSPQAIAAQARWQKVLRTDAEDASLTMRDAYGFTDAIAERLSLSRQTIERDLLLHRRLPASAVEQLRGHAVLGNATQLRALARLEASEQRRVIAKLLAGARTVSEARAQLHDNRRPQPEDKRLSAFLGAFQRMGLPEKKGALAELVGLLSAQTATHLVAELKDSSWL